MTRDGRRCLVGFSGLPLTGLQFLAGEPFSSGRAAVADRVTNADGTTTLLLGYPADQVQVQLTQDAAGRLVRETLTDPNHITSRSFLYPEPGEQ